MNFRIASLYLLVISRFIFRFFTTNLYGILILVLAFYFMSPLVGIQPFTFSELLNWLYELPAVYKTAALSSLLTIIGFLIAFQTATTNWKRQLQANIRLEAEKETYAIYLRISELISSMAFYADQYLRLIKLKKEEGQPADMLLQANYVLSLGQQFQSNREELSLLLQKAYQIVARHYKVFSATYGVVDNLTKVNKAVARVTSKMWILLPSPEYLQNGLFGFEDSYIGPDREKELLELRDMCNRKLPCQVDSLEVEVSAYFSRYWAGVILPRASCGRSSL